MRGILVETENIRVTIEKVKEMVNGLSGMSMAKKKLMVSTEMMYHGKDSLKIIIIVMVKLLKNMLNTITMVKKRLLAQ